MKNDVTQVSQKPRTINQSSNSFPSKGASTRTTFSIGSHGGSAASLASNLASTNTNGCFYGHQSRFNGDVNSNLTQISQKPTSINQNPYSFASAPANPNNSTCAYTPMPTNIGLKDSLATSLTSNLAGMNIPNGYFYGQQTRFNADMLTGGAYANTASHGIWPNGYGGYFPNLQQATPNVYATPTKGSKISVSSKASPKPPLSSSKSNDTTVFDENTELKERIKELEAQLGLETRPLAPKKAFKLSCNSVNIKPDQSLSVSNSPLKEVKKDPETPLKIDTPIKDLNKHDRKWIARYEELVTYQKTHGHTMVPSAFKPLGPWVSRQRREKKKGILSEERTAMLEDIDFVWVAM
jgi:hypothetical protein